jgi:membrane-associated phospholipid phosphatase
MTVPAGERRSATRPRGRRRVARLVTEVLAPAPIAAVLLLIVAWRSAPTIPQRVAWGVVAVLFAILSPLLFVLRGVRRGTLTDHHVGLREQRPLPLLVGMACVLAGLMPMLVWGAPRELVALVAAMLAGLLVSLLVTLVWKLSLHAGVAAGSLVILVLEFGPPLLALLPVVALVGWARVEAGDHSPAQVAVGALLGAAVAAAVFSLLR